MPLSVREYLQRGSATSKEIQAATGLNQKAVSRQINKMGDEIVKFKQGRTVIYAVTRNAFGVDDKIPLFRVDSHGNTELVAVVRPLAHGGFFVSTEPGTPRLLLGEKGNGLFDDLPYFLSDLAPQGFIGRQIAKDIAIQSQSFPSDPRHWNSNHIGSYLISNGDDLPGDFKFGYQAGLRRRARPVIVTRKEYPKLAQEAIQGYIGGSSAGGEQPKFTAYCDDCSAHVIVKFSPKGNSDIARRWRDILITEHYANQVLHSLNLPAAETTLIEEEGRLFLESIRFDRIGMYGRNSMISLQFADMEFVGCGGSWVEAIDGLYREGLIGAFHRIDVILLWNFGRLINNTDMHLGNLSLSLDGGTFRLCPVYDMCSMGFAPRNGVEVAAISFEAPAINNNLTRAQLMRINNGAHEFWEVVRGDSRISSEFKAYLDQGNPVQMIK